MPESPEDWVRVRDKSLDDRTFSVRRVTAEADPDAFEIVSSKDDPAADERGFPQPPRFADEKKPAAAKKAADSKENS